MRQKRRKRFPMTNKITKTNKPTQTLATVNEEPHTVASVAEQGATVASSKAASKKVTSQKKNATQGRRKAPGQATKSPKSVKAAVSQPRSKRKKTDTPDAPQTPRAPKPQSKGAQLLALIGRDHGASLTELKEATGWAAHSVRGFLSTANKKQNLKISSIKNEVGERVYKTGQ